MRAGQAAYLSASGRVVAQKVWTAVRQGHLTVKGMSDPGRVAADASAAQDAGRSDAILGWHPGAAHDCQWASDPDFLTAMAAT